MKRERIKPHDGFRIRYVDDFPQGAVDAALDKREYWLGLAPVNSRVVVLTRLEGFPEPVVVKFFPTVQVEDADNGLKGSRLRQLSSRYAAKEARSFHELNAAGVGVPPLYVWGEQWRHLLRYQGMIIMGYVDQPDLGRRLKQGDVSWVDAASRALARLHNAGLVHRDCYPRNLFEHDGDITMIDLETVGRIKPHRRLADLKRLLVPLWCHFGEPSVMNAAFETYCRYIDKGTVDTDFESDWLRAAQKKFDRGLSEAHLAEHSHLINEL